MIATGSPTGFPGVSTYYGQMMFDYVDADGNWLRSGTVVRRYVIMPGPSTT